MVGRRVSKRPMLWAYDSPVGTTRGPNRLNLDLKAEYSSSPSAIRSQADKPVPDGLLAIVRKLNAFYGRVPRGGEVVTRLALLSCRPYESHSPHLSHPEEDENLSDLLNAAVKQRKVRNS
jgi:hypothetical protein